MVRIPIRLFLHAAYCVLEKDIGLSRLIAGVFSGAGFIAYELVLIAVHFFTSGKWTLVPRKQFKVKMKSFI